MKPSVSTPPLTPVESDDESGRRVFVREARSLPHVEAWPHRPIMICVNSAACSSLKVPQHGLSPCPIGIPFKICSDLFEGSCLMRVNGIRGDNPDPRDQDYFKGRKRLFQCIVQGRFKEKVPASDVMTGQEFARPAKNIPSKFMLKRLTSIGSKFVPGGKLVAHGDQPYYEAPMLCCCSVVRCDKSGNEPDISCHDIQEDCSLFGGVFADESISISQRKQIFSDPSKCEDFVFDTESVYTFEKYYHGFDPHSYTLDCGFSKIHFETMLNGQPLQQLGKMRDGRYLWSFQIWNEKLMPEGTSSLVLEKTTRALLSVYSGQCDDGGPPPATAALDGDSPISINTKSDCMHNAILTEKVTMRRSRASAKHVQSCRDSQKKADVGNHFVSSSSSRLSLRSISSFVETGKQTCRRVKSSLGKQSMKLATLPSNRPYGSHELTCRRKNDFHGFLLKKKSVIRLLIRTRQSKSSCLLRYDSLDNFI